MNATTPKGGLTEKGLIHLSQSLHIRWSLDLLASHAARVPHAHLVDAVIPRRIEEIDVVLGLAQKRAGQILRQSAGPEEFAGRAVIDSRCGIPCIRLAEGLVKRDAEIGPVPFLLIHPGSGNPGHLPYFLPGDTPSGRARIIDSLFVFPPCDELRIIGRIQPLVVVLVFSGMRGRTSRTWRTSATGWHPRPRKDPFSPTGTSGRGPQRFLEWLTSPRGSCPS